MVPYLLCQLPSTLKEGVINSTRCLPLSALTLLDNSSALRQAQGPRAREPQAQHSIQGDALEGTTTSNKKQETLLDYVRRDDTNKKPGTPNSPFRR